MAIDLIEETDLPSDSDPWSVADEVTCDDCGVVVPLSPGGRQYRKCAEHRSTARKPATRARRAANWETKLSTEIHDIVSGIGTLVSFADQFDGMTIKAGSQRFATSLMGPARQNDKVRVFLERTVEGGAWGAVIMSALAILLPILLHHGIIPSSLFGKTAPDAATFDPSKVGHVSV